MEVFEIIFDMLNELVIDKAFNKKMNIRRRLPYIVIYYITIILLLVFTTFLSINYIKEKNIVGYPLALIDIILFLLLLLPLFNLKNK